MDKVDNQKVTNMLTELNHKANIVYEFVLSYYEFIHSKHDYGTGVMMSVMDMHTLTYIEENPGVTITELSLAKNKTKSAFSQSVKRLVEKEYVIKKKSENNPRIQYLYPTKKGENLSFAHKLYDVSEMTKTMSYLATIFSEEELMIFYKVLQKYKQYLDNV